MVSLDAGHSDDRRPRAIKQAGAARPRLPKEEKLNGDFPRNFFLGLRVLVPVGERQGRGLDAVMHAERAHDDEKKVENLHDHRLDARI